MAEKVITVQNFEEDVLHSEVPVLLDFWATWCGPCRMLAPILEEVAKEYEGKLIIGKVNVDEEPNLANEFQVMSIPTLLLFQNGEVTKASVGYRTKEQLKAMLE